MAGILSSDNFAGKVILGKFLEKNEFTLPALQAHNPEISQEAQEFMQHHARNKRKGMRR